jgi:hypothetical protein
VFEQQDKAMLAFVVSAVFFAAAMVLTMLALRDLSIKADENSKNAASAAAGARAANGKALAAIERNRKTICALGRYVAEQPIILAPGEAKGHLKRRVKRDTQFLKSLKRVGCSAGLAPLIKERERAVRRALNALDTVVGSGTGGVIASLGGTVLVPGRGSARRSPPPVLPQAPGLRLPDLPLLPPADPPPAPQPPPGGGCSLPLSLCDVIPGG